METQWLVIMGTKGTCKTNLATSLSRHLMQCVCEDGDEEGEEAVVINYNVEKEGLEVCVCVYVCVCVCVCMCVCVLSEGLGRLCSRFFLSFSLSFANF